MPRPRRNLAVLLLAAALLTPWCAFAAPAEARSASPSWEPHLWNLLTALWVDAGCGLDPRGGSWGGALSAPPAPPVSPDEGCGLDPSGSCGSSH
jgi:hypothetical protein